MGCASGNGLSEVPGTTTVGRRPHPARNRATSPASDPGPQMATLLPMPYIWCRSRPRTELAVRTDRPTAHDNFGPGNGRASTTKSQSSGIVSPRPLPNSRRRSPKYRNARPNSAFPGTDDLNPVTPPSGIVPGITVTSCPRDEATRANSRPGSPAPSTAMFKGCAVCCT